MWTGRGQAFHPHPTPRQLRKCSNISSNHAARRCRDGYICSQCLKSTKGFESYGFATSTRINVINGRMWGPKARGIFRFPEIDIYDVLQAFSRILARSHILSGNETRDRSLEIMQFIKFQFHNLVSLADICFDLHVFLHCHVEQNSKGNECFMTVILTSRKSSPHPHNPPHAHKSLCWALH